MKMLIKYFSLFFITTFLIYSCSDYVAGLNVINASSETNLFSIKYQSGSEETKTLKPGEIWNYGYLVNNNLNWKLIGNYDVSCKDEKITVYVDDKKEVIVEWDGICFIER